MDNERFLTLQRMAGVPQRFQGATLDSLRETGAVMPGFAEVVERVQEWLLEEDQWALVLQGPPGTGKTAIASAMLGALPAPGIFVTATSLVDSARNGTRADYLSNACMSLIDDVGAEYATYYSNNFLDGVVADHYEREGRLVLTTNFGDSELAEAYSARMVDRLHDGGTWLSCDWSSFRRL